MSAGIRWAAACLLWVLVFVPGVARGQSSGETERVIDDGAVDAGTESDAGIEQDAGAELDGSGAQSESTAAVDPAPEEEQQLQEAEQQVQEETAVAQEEQPAPPAPSEGSFRGGRSAELMCKESPQLRVDPTMRRGPIGLSAAMTLGGGLGQGGFDGVAQAEAGIRFLNSRFYGVFGGSTLRANYHYGFGVDLGYGYRDLEGWLFRGGAAVLFPAGEPEQVYDFHLGAGLIGTRSATSLMLHARTDETIYLALQVDYLGETRLGDQRRLAAEDQLSRNWKIALIASGVAALMGGAAMDVLPESARNQQLDATDFAPPFLYAGGLAALFVALRQ